MVFILAVYDRSAPIPPIIRLIAVNWRGRKIGKLNLTRLTLHSNSYSGYIESKQSGQGIPKKLIDGADKILQRIANQHRSTLQHRVNFSNQESLRKLTKYYLAIGYTRTHDRLVKVYKPE